MDTKALRQKILDLAIRGKLVPQDPNDEPASILLERIRAEKERLIAEGKIKRPKSSTKGRSLGENAKASSSESHYRKFTPPFSIPDSWQWVKLECIGEVITGSTPSKDHNEYYGGNYPFFKPSDLEQGLFTLTASDHLTHKGFEQARQLSKDSILVTCIGATIGKTGRILTEGSCNQQINAVVLHKDIVPEYFYYVCLSDYFQTEIKRNASATTLPILNKNNFSALELPLPPVREQIRIIETLSKFFSYLDKIEDYKSTLTSIIAITKAKILELAMQGKLVPQDLADEPAADMLRRVNPKARIITDNPHSRNIPESWVWVRIKDIFNPMERCIPNGITFKYIDIDSIDNKKNIAYPKEIQSNNAPSRASRKTNKGNVVFSMVRPYLRNIAVVTEEDCIASTGFFVLNPTSAIDENFTFMLALAPYFVDGLNSYMKGDNSPSINKNNVEDFIIGLPPLNEQKRIEAKIEELYAVLDKIEASLQS